ncbi:MAG: hypothetical protein LQ352_002493 [Teloschistes flavicans]|nr:MAG: hypothetical protein LQ352_002493 [Teloschistes flavicans]
MSQLSSSITLEQLAEHNTLQSLWIAVHGYGTDRARPVYDLTTFSSDHPGGIEALENCAGTDGTDSYDYAGHSDSNMEKMQQYRVGTLAGSLEQPSPISQNIIPVESKRIKSAISYLEHLEFPGWTKLAVTICAASLVVALSYHQRNGLVDYISFTTKMPRLQFGITSEQNIGQAFWAVLVDSRLSERRIQLSSYDTEEDEEIGANSPGGEI